jgi:5-methylcytosine-specific restriction endonuclease McrA
MRTPNTQCLLCGKPLYRRPYELAKTRFAACMACRSEAQKAAGITDAQQAGLSLGRPKGTNHRTGYRHREESKRKVADANRRFYAEHPEKAIERGAKIRGDKNVRWNGGSSRLNDSIRRMTENRKWMDAVKERDGACVRCGSGEHLESHHLVELADLMARLGIKSRDDARRHAALLWDLGNGITLCETCHYVEHGRTRRAVA